MKKVLSVIMIMLLCAALLCSCGKKEDAVDTGETENSVTVFAVISSEGSLEVYEEVQATDVDGDGVISVSDAIACTHDVKFDGGAAAGYLAQDTEYGISIADVTTGDFFVTEVDTERKLLDELNKFSPSEIICNEACRSTPKHARYTRSRSPMYGRPDLLHRPNPYRETTYDL